MSCAISASFCKAVGENLDYMVDWTTWLGTDVITTSAWTVTGAISEGAKSSNDTQAIIWLSGGILTDVYTITNTITTNTGRIAVRAFLIKITKR